MPEAREVHYGLQEGIGCGEGMGVVEIAPQIATAFTRLTSRRATLYVFAMLKLQLLNLNLNSLLVQRQIDNPSPCEPHGIFDKNLLTFFTFSYH